MFSGYSTGSCLEAKDEAHPLCDPSQKPSQGVPNGENASDDN